MRVGPTYYKWNIFLGRVYHKEKYNPTNKTRQKIEIQGNHDLFVFTLYMQICFYSVYADLGVASLAKKVLSLT